jgi:hypothetical protein
MNIQALEAFEFSSMIKNLKDIIKLFDKDFNDKQMIKSVKKYINNNLDQNITLMNLIKSHI